MDCIFNKNIPKSDENTFIFRPTNKTWINGMSNNYELADYPALYTYVDKRNLSQVFTRINEDLFTYWPCPTCFCYGYLFSLCTLGISFLCTYTCIKDAKASLHSNIERFNEKVFAPAGLLMSYKTMCCTSYIEIKIVNQQEAPKQTASDKEEKLIKVINNQV